jgi:hypothetical protein
MNMPEEKSKVTVVNAKGETAEIEVAVLPTIKLYAKKYWLHGAVLALAAYVISRDKASK